MAYFSIKDFTTSVAAKVRSVVVNTDENLPAHVIQDTAGNDVIGTKIEAKSTATDTTSVSFMQVFKQISFSIQAAAASLASLVTAWGATAIDFGSGALSSRTLRTISATDDPLITALTGSVADGGTDSGNSSKVAGIAKSGLSGETLLSAGQRSPMKTGLDGALYVRPVPLEDCVSNFVSCASGANTSCIAAQGANIKFYLCGGFIYNNGASNGALLITDGSGGTTKAKPPFPASTGTVFTLPVPIAFSANTAVFVDPTGSDTIDVTLFGFKGK